MEGLDKHNFRSALSLEKSRRGVMVKANHLSHHIGELQMDFSKRFLQLYMLFMFCQGGLASAQSVFISDTASWQYTFAVIPGWFDYGSLDQYLSVGKAPFGNQAAKNAVGWSYNTEFPEWSTLYVRKTFKLSHDFSNMQIQIGWDNVFSLYINGAKIDSVDKGGYAQKWQRTISVPNSVFKPDSDNVIALLVNDYSGGTGFDLILTGSGTVVNSVDPESAKLGRFMLRNNYPNPFNPSTVITYELPTSESTTLEIYDEIGKKIETLIDALQTAGVHSVTFNATTLASGVYFCRLQAGRYIETKKIVLVK